MQGVADAEPVDGEVSAGAERAVAEACVGQVAELDEEAVAECLFREPLEHVTEDGFGVDAVRQVFSVSEDFTSVDDAGRKQADTAPDDGQEAGYRLSVETGHDEQRPVSRRRFVDAEQGRRVEGVVSRQGRDVTSRMICRQFQRHHRQI